MNFKKGFFSVGLKKGIYKKYFDAKHLKWKQKREKLQL